MFSDKGSVCSDCYSASTVLREYVLDKTPEIRLHFRCRVIDGAKWGQLMGEGLVKGTFHAMMDELHRDCGENLHTNGVVQLSL